MRVILILSFFAALFFVLFVKFDNRRSNFVDVINSFFVIPFIFFILEKLIFFVCGGYSNGYVDEKDTTLFVVIYGAYLIFSLIFIIKSIIQNPRQKQCCSIPIEYPKFLALVYDYENRLFFSSLVCGVLILFYSFSGSQYVDFNGSVQWLLNGVSILILEIYLFLTFLHYSIVLFYIPNYKVWSKRGKPFRVTCFIIGCWCLWCLFVLFWGLISLEYYMNFIDFIFECINFIGKLFLLSFGVSLILISGVYVYQRYIK